MSYLRGQDGARSERPLLRLVHTADVHIGDDPSRESRLIGLRAVVDAAIDHAAHALIIAGDLFDNARLRPKEITPALDELSRLSIPIFLTPGNHDCLGGPSIYDRVLPGELGPNVHFFNDPEGSHTVREDLGLTVWSRGLVEHSPKNQPLKGHSPKVESHWQVALAHGYFYPDGEEPGRSSPMTASEVGRLECDYLALGHWHRFQDVSVGDTAACYPGSPSEHGGTFPGANLITLDPMAGVLIERIQLPGGIAPTGGFARFD